MAVLTALAIILLRYWILPDVEQYHDNITSSFSEAIGNTITIGKIEGDWQGLHPRLSFTDVRILDEKQQPAIVLPRITSSVSWMSLFTAELRLYSLDIDRPELLVRRDAQGKLFVGDMAQSRQDGNNNLGEWLLHQSHVAVHDALIVWVDEQRDAPPLVLRQVNLHIDNLPELHRFALRALPPEDLATPLDVRGDFRGASFNDLNKWHGQIFTQIDFTDVMVWQKWLDMPKELKRGRGALRAWLSFEAGSVAGITADMALYNVTAKLAEDAPEMALANLRGRVAWKDVAGGSEYSTRKLTVRLQDGTELQPLDLFVRTTKAINEQPASGEVQINLLQLERLASLASYLPLEHGMRARLEAYSPRGNVTNLNVQWQGMLEKPVSYKIKGQFEGLALRQVGEMPGFSGLTLDVDGSDTSGKLYISSHQLVVDAPGVMREPLSFANLLGQVSWQRERNELKIILDQTVLSNEDLAGSLSGSYQAQAGALGMLDLTASLTRVEARQAARYIPLGAMNMENNEWLKGALLAGHFEGFSIRIRGNLSDLKKAGQSAPDLQMTGPTPTPADDKEALINIEGRIKNVVLEFNRNWPRVENLNGDFLMRGNRLEMKSLSATMLGADLRNATVTLPDMTSDDLPLEINGEAAAGVSTFLQFVQQSPVRGYMGGATDGVKASGNGLLNYFLHIPLLGEKPAKVSCTFRVQDSDIDLGKGVPLLRNTHGEFMLTESGIQASGVSAEILGGAASINVQTAENGTMHASVKGNSSFGALREINPHPLLNYLHGSTAWDADITLDKKSFQLTINSDLRGISSSLPQPFTKSANELMPLRVENKSIADGQDLITAQLNSLFDARLERQEKNGAMAIKRGTIIFGRQGKLAGASKVKKNLPRAKLPVKALRSKSGIWIAGSLPELSIQGWDGLIGGESKTGTAFPIAGINLYIDKLGGYGQTIKSLRIDAVKRGDGLSAQLDSSALNGEVAWLPRGYKKGGKFSAHLRNLYLAIDEQPEPTSSPPVKPGASALTGTTGKAAAIRPGKLPAMEIVIENLHVKEKQLGRFEMVGHPDRRDWRMRRLNITNPDGSLVGDGVWRTVQGKAQTQINLQLKLSDAGNTLARYGYPNTVKKGSGKLAANLSWAGTPGEFNYASLNGTLNLDTGKGRFLKMEPGAGKLLSILSLQALPSRITLDFNDAFSEGFQFENIKGNATIKNGVIDTQDLYIYGSSARVTMKGSVDLNSETQDLLVRILPTVGDSVSLISAFAAGPAIGVGTLIVNKILGDPLDKFVSFEYNVSGTWSEPNVVKVVNVPVPYK